MAKKNKTLIYGGIALGAVALGTILYFTVIKKMIAKKTDTQPDNSGGTGGASTTTTGQNIINLGQTAAEQAGIGKQFKVGYVSERKADKQLVVHFAAPRPPKDTIKVGRKISLTKMDKYNGFYKVIGTWEDSRGDQGAIYLNSTKITADNNENKTWENKGIITVII